MKKKIIVLGIIVSLIYIIIDVYKLNNRNDSIKNITLSELDNIIDGNVKQEIYVYIGRDSCETCSIFYPELMKIVNIEKMNLVYYNTELDRNNNRQEMDKVLKKIDVVEVPYVLYFLDGVMKDSCTGEEFIKQYHN